jgi:hypothetical protein
MRRSSKIILVVSFLLAAIAITGFVYAPYLQASQPDLTEAQARIQLNDLATALENRKTSQVLAFASPDAKVAGQQLEKIEKALQQAFANAQNLQVSFKDPVYTRNEREKAVLMRCTAEVKATGVEPMSLPVTFTFQRREKPLLFGLLKTYEWKITNVDAQIGIPGFF